MTWHRQLIAALASLGVAGGFASIFSKDAFSQPSQTGLASGFIRFMAYHEAGHLLLNQVQGMNTSNQPREDIERFADQIAAFLLVPDPGDPAGVNEMIGAANGWLRTGVGQAANDPHAPPEERAYNIICMVYGSNPAAFAAFRQYLDASWDCEAQFKEIDDAIEYEFVNDSDQMGLPIELTYEPASPETVAAKAYLEDSEILDDLVADIEQEFRLDRRTRLVGMSCKGKGDEGTFHFDTFQSADPSKNFDQIAICYELVDMWMKEERKAPQ